MDWARLVTGGGVRAVVVQRDALANYCSIQRARTLGDYGHTPEKHVHNASEFVCPENSKAARLFVKTVPALFNATRRVLTDAGREFLELPFAQYVKAPNLESRRILAFAGLGWPSAAWGGTCSEPWCSAYKWPQPKPDSSILL